MNPMRFHPGEYKPSCCGQAMVESVFVVIVICLCFLALFQYATLFADKLILTHAATRAARSRAVGFNHWMVDKSARVAAIPASGKRLTPTLTGIDTALQTLLRQNRIGEIWDQALTTTPQSAASIVEAARVPDYMASINEPTGNEILNYEGWETLTVDIDEPVSLDGTSPAQLTVRVLQEQALLLPREGLIEGEIRPIDPENPEKIRLRGEYAIESHYPLYLEDMGW